MSTMADLASNAPSAVAMPDGYQLQADAKGYYGNIRFVFDGADLFGFTSTVTGLPKTFTIFGTTVTRLIPLIHPYISGGNCYCDSVNVYPPPGVAASWDGVAIAFPYYFADVHFSTPQYSMETGDSPTVTISRTASTERVTRPGSSYTFGDGTRPNHDVGVPVELVDYRFAMHKLPSLDNSLYDSLIGCVNSEPFFGHDPGTVLYKGCSSTGQFIVAGNPVYDASQDFQYRSVPHNYIMRPDGAGFDKPYQANFTGTDSAGNPKYLHYADDLNALWGN